MHFVVHLLHLEANRRNRHAPACTIFGPPAPSYPLKRRTAVPCPKQTAVHETVTPASPPHPAHQVEDRFLPLKQTVPWVVISRSRATTTTRVGLRSRPDRPAFVPRTTGRRQEMTGTAGASNPQVRNQIRPSPQAARSPPRTLSRWRHGFEPRWDYAGQGPGPGVMSIYGPALAPRRTRTRHGSMRSRSTCLRSR